MRPSQTARVLQSFSLTLLPLLTMGLLTTAARCQAAPSHNSVQGAQPAPASASQPQVAFPIELLPAGKPGVSGKAPLGIKADELWALGKQWYPYNDKVLLNMLKNAASELGEVDVPVEPFFLGKFPVTNEQYQIFVKATGARSPFHWWKWGNKANFLEHQKKIAKLAKELEAQKMQRKEAELRYWEANWRDLEFAIPKGEEQFPVVFVSYNDALKYCGWAGMRLPTEAEWTYAVTGGQRKMFLFGQKWDPKLPEKVGLGAARDRNSLKPVGSLGPTAAGPFGHQDMLGQVWEWVLGIGYGPQVGEKKHEREYAKLRQKVAKNKRLAEANRSLPEAIAFNDDRALVKGSGSIYSFSGQRWDQLRVNVRAPLTLEQTIEGVGFRTAKSYRAARDMSLSRLRSEYVGNQYFLTDQKLDLDRQEGVESYDLRAGGRLIEDYHAISFVPTTFLTNEKRLSSKAMQDHSQRKPVILGTLITTEEIKNPALKKGIYTVYYRYYGLPKELTRALAEGASELKKAEKERLAAEKAAKKKGRKKKPKKEKKAAKEAPAKADPKKKKGPTWRQIIARYGFKESDFKDEKGLINKKFANSVDYIYLKQPEDKRLKIPAKDNSLILFRDNDGVWAAMTLINKRYTLKPGKRTQASQPCRLGLARLTPAQIKAGKKANEVVEFPFAVANTKADSTNRRGKATAFMLTLELPKPPAAGKAWRTNATFAAAKDGDNAKGNGNGKDKSKAASNGRSK